MQKKKLLRKTLLEEKEEEGQEVQFLPEKYWEGVQARYRIAYVDQGDGEYYPIPLPVGELIQDLLQDVARLERVLVERKIKLLGRVSPITPIYIKNNKRIVLSIRVFMDDK